MEFGQTEMIVTGQIYGVVPKGLLTFLGSLYKEGAKTTSGTLVYRFERQTARKNSFFLSKHCVPNLECRILSQEHDTIGKQNKQTKIVASLAVTKATANFFL